MQTKVLCLLIPALSDGFFISTTTSKQRVTSVALRQSNSWDFGREDSFDVEAARRRLESLVSSGGSSTAAARPLIPKRFSPEPPSSSPKATSTPTPPSSAISPPLDVVLPPAPPMTTLERARRLAEQELLAKLTEGDEALTDLWDLWFQERGSDAAARLLHAEELTGQGPRHWPEAETVLSSLIEEHGVYWAEPVNRLATLYYMQGRLEEAETLCKMVLAVKPWHFGALSGIVMIYASLHDSEKARQWAARRLPTFAPTGPNRRRHQWVETALKDSRAALEDGEQRNLDWMGPKDDYESLNDAWQ